MEENLKILLCEDDENLGMLLFRLRAMRLCFVLMAKLVTENSKRQSLISACST